jgi:predicted DNA-binding transcriptional regulator YafY
MAAARWSGGSLDEIRSEFGVSHPTAQRMTDALEVTFSNLSVSDGEDRKRRWQISDRALHRPRPRAETALEALAIAARTAEDQRRLRRARALLDPEVVDAVLKALRGPLRLRIRYGAEDAAPWVIEPHGVLLGHRSYLVARLPARGERLLNLRMDRIRDPDCLDESFELEDGFTIDAYAARAFGVYQDPAQHGEVVRRFTPEAAERAAEFRVHPSRSLERDDDGSLTVRFSASGWLEMAGICTNGATGSRSSRPLD